MYINTDYRGISLGRIKHFGILKMAIKWVSWETCKNTTINQKEKKLTLKTKGKKQCLLEESKSMEIHYQTKGHKFKKQ